MEIKRVINLNEEEFNKLTEAVTVLQSIDSAIWETKTADEASSGIMETLKIISSTIKHIVTGA